MNKENNENSLKHIEMYRNPTMIANDFFHIEISSVTSNYLRKIGMSDDEIIKLHQSVWDLSFPFAKPSERDKYSRSDAKEIKNLLERKYGIDDYNAPLEGEPSNMNYEKSIETALNMMTPSSKILIAGAPAAGKTTLARKIKRKADKLGFDVGIYENFNDSKYHDGPTILVEPYISEEKDGDLRIYVQASTPRRTLNSLKSLLTFKYSPGLIVEDLSLRYRYELDFQKSISDIVVKYSAGRLVLPDLFVNVHEFLEDDYV